MGGFYTIDNLLNIFISSKDSLVTERDSVETVIHELNMNPIRAESNKYFATPNSKEYLRQIEKCHIVILLIDLTKNTFKNNYNKYIEEEIRTALLSGKSILAFFKCEKNKENTGKIDRLIKRIQSNSFAHKFTTLEDLRDSVKRSILNELFRKYISKPSFLSSSYKIYNETSKLIKNCQYTFFLSQQSPTILLGPRIGRDYEKFLFDNLISLIKKKSKNREITFIFDSEKTKIELQEHISDYNKKNISNNILFLENFFKENQDLPLRVIDRKKNTVQFVISDRSYILGNHTEHMAFAILDENSDLITKIKDEIMKMSSCKKDSGLNAFKTLFKDIMG